MILPKVQCYNNNASCENLLLCLAPLAEEDTMVVSFKKHKFTITKTMGHGRLSYIRVSTVWWRTSYVKLMQDGIQTC